MAEERSKYKSTIETNNRTHDSQIEILAYTDFVAMGIGNHWFPIESQLVLYKIIEELIMVNNIVWGQHDELAISHRMPISYRQKIESILEDESKAAFVETRLDKEKKGQSNVKS